MKNLLNMRALTLLPIIGLMLFSSCKKDEVEEPDVTPEPAVLDCNYFTSSRTLIHNPDLSVDYIVPCQATVSASLMIEPGVVIHFESGAGLSVTGSGSINAVGTSSSPVIFDGVSGVSGSWAGIYISSNNVNNILDHVRVRNAGGEAFNSNDDKANLILYAGGRLNLSNSTISGSEGLGIINAYDDFNLSITSSHFANNGDAPLYLMANNVHNVDASCTFSGNAKSYLRVGTEYITAEVTWQKLTIPYRLEATDNGITKHMQIPSGTGLTLEEGVQFEFGSDTYIKVIDGYLSAIGSAADPIVFSGGTAVPGSWRGLAFDSGDVRNQMENVQIVNAGGGEMFGEDGSIVIWADTYLSIVNSEIKDGAAPCGINAPLTGETLITTGTIFTNITTDICQ